MSFDPGQTTRILVAKAKRRVIPRDQWKSRASDWSAIMLAAVAAWQGLQALIPPEVWALLPAQAKWAVPFAFGVLGWVAKFIKQRVEPENADANK